MKKFYLLTKTLLVAALLMVGATNAWAGVSTYDFQNYCKGLATKATIALTTGSGAGKVNNTNVYVVNDVSDATYGDFDFDGKFAIQNTDITFRRGGGTQGTADGNAGLQNTNNARYFAVLNLTVGDQIVFTTTEGALKFVTTNVTYDNSGTPTAPAQWDAVTSGTTYTVTTAGTLGLQLQKLGIINSIVITSSSETVSAPTIAMTAASGTSRTVSITSGTSDEGNEVTTYYTTNGDTPTSSSTVYSEPFVLSDGNYTVKAITISTTPTSSDVTSLAVDATAPASLNAPVINLTAFNANGGVFNPNYSFTSNQGSVVGAPTATLSYSFNGGAATEGTSYTATTTGTLRVTASAAGYASAYTDLEVTCAEFLKTYVFDATSDITINDGAPTTYTNYTINGKGCDLYALSNCTFSTGKSISFDGNMQFAWAKTANEAYCLFARTNKSTVSYSLNDGEYIEFTSFGSPVISSSATSSTTLAWYSSVRQINVYTPSVSVEVSSAGYATYVNSDYDLDFSATDIKAYKAQVNTTTGVITLTQVNNVPAGTPVVLYYEGGKTEYIPVMTGASAVSDNDLKAGNGAAVATEDGAGHYNYVLDDVVGIGFYKANGVIVASNRAYLQTTYNVSGPAARGMSLVFADDILTGINEAEASTEAVVKEGKFFVNGQLRIFKKGQMFNANGQLIK